MTALSDFQEQLEAGPGCGRLIMLDTAPLDVDVPVQDLRLSSTIAEIAVSARGEQPILVDLEHLISDGTARERMLQELWMLARLTGCLVLTAAPGAADAPLEPYVDDVAFPSAV